jgi:hypothetical protein
VWGAVHMKFVDPQAFKIFGEPIYKYKVCGRGGVFVPVDNDMEVQCSSALTEFQQGVSPDSYIPGIQY